MNPALAFIFVAVALLAVVLLVLSVALWRGAQQAVHHNSAGWAAYQADTIHDPAQANAAVYRDQMAELDREFVIGNVNYEELKAARDELSQRLLADVDAAGVRPSADHEVPVGSATASTTVSGRKPWLGIVLLVVVIPVSSMLMYSVWGQPAALDPLALKQGIGSSAEVTPEKLSEMAAALMRRLQDEPNSIEGWVMLGRVQRALGHFKEAAQAYGKALTLSRDDDLAIERAEVLAQKNGGSFAGEPWSVIQHVLRADPHHVNALVLAGSASYGERNFRSALRFWERAREVVSPDSPDASELDRAMAQAREKIGLSVQPPRSTSSNTDVRSASQSADLGQSRISGRASLDPALQHKVAPTDTVFVYATAVTGSRMPVAILRTTADQLPLNFVLDDSTAMNPSSKLSGMSAVTVHVRISKSGQAMAQPGDYGVSLSPVKAGSTGLNLRVRDALQTTP